MSPRPPVRILASTATARIISTEYSRRRFLSVATAVAGAGLLAACSSKPRNATVASGGALEDRLSIYSWGDYDDPAVLEDFTADHGPQITLDAFNSNEEMIAKLVAAKGTSGYDIVLPAGPFIPQMVENGLLMKFNHDLLPNLKHMDPAFLGRDWDPNNDYSVCKTWGTTGFVYDKTKFDRDLFTWEDFLDASQNEASGKVSVLDDPAEIAGLYFWSRGIDWNTTDPAHLDDCEDFIVNTLAPHISAFDSAPGSSAIPLGTQMLMQVWNGDARAGIMESADPTRWQWRLGSPATELWMDNWAIAAGAPHPEAAHAFLNFVMEPENKFRELDYNGYPTGAIGVEEEARAAGLEMLDLVFFDEKQVETMHTQVISGAQQRFVDIWNKSKAAAGA